MADPVANRLRAYNIGQNAHPSPQISDGFARDPAKTPQISAENRPKRT
jgi:hypothetical protein